MIDSHCHLNDEKFNSDIDNVISTYLNAGITKVLNVGASYKDSIICHNQAKMYDSVYYSIGVHPEDCKVYSEEKFEELINDCLTNKEFIIRDKNDKNKLLAIGEIGLDYYWTKDNKETQKEVFESQIKLAQKYNLPIIIHNRDASGDILEILKKNAPYKYGGIIHCFSASLEWAREVLNLGFYISFSGSITYKNSTNLQNVAKQIPIDKILVETDSPYLAPLSIRGQRNEPKNVIETAKLIANLKNINMEEFDKIITNNFNKLFNF